MIHPKGIGIEDFRHRIQTGEPFDFSKWGDGEFNAIFQDTKSGCNCDGHQYFPEMGERLLNILKSNPSYDIGLQNLAYTQRPDQIESLSEEYGLVWCGADVLHRASIKGQFQALLDDLKKRDVVLVGPTHLARLAGLNEWGLVAIPAKDCWKDYEHIKGVLEKLIEPDTVVMYCCSMMSGILIDDFHGQATQIDMGSVLDPYAGKQSRLYHRKLEI